MISAYPKIFQLKDRYTQDIFKDAVEVTEKIDGSQFVFGKVEGELFIRSKGQRLYAECCPKMFREGFDYVSRMQYTIPNNTIFYCEYLQKPKHNVLKYTRVPKNNLILFGVSENAQFFLRYPEIEFWSKQLDIECVPLLYAGKIADMVTFSKFLELESVLGGCKIEGVVIKNYNKDILCGGMAIPVMCAKYVSEKFKEKHKKDWKKENTSKGKWETYCMLFRKEARWLKAVQHLRENNKLSNESKDIGSIIAEVKRDIIDEEKDNILDFMWKEFSDQLLRKSVGGLAEWYKKYLLEDK